MGILELSITVIFANCNLGSYVLLKYIVCSFNVYELMQGIHMLLNI